MQQKHKATFIVVKKKRKTLDPGSYIMSFEFVAVVVVSLRVVVCLRSAAAHGISSWVCGRFFLIRLARLPYFLLS
jgi:hypothetical protein